MKIIITIVALMCFISVYSQRFAGIDYRLFSKQVPISESQDLEGELVNFKEFSFDLSYPWLISKKSDSSLIFVTFEYNHHMSGTIIDPVFKEKFEQKIPEYLYHFPNTQEMSLLILYSRNICDLWNFNVGFTETLSGDFKYDIDKQSFNNSGLLYLQRKFSNVGIGIGSVLFILDGKIKAFPLANLSYSKNKFGIEFMPPLSLQMNYKMNSKFSLNIDGALEFGGFKANYLNTNLATNYLPDYIETTDMDFSFSFHHRFFDTLCWSFELGYLYRELIFLESEKEIDKLMLQGAIMFGIGIYSTF